jgi:hypothetical protein
MERIEHWCIKITKENSLIVGAYFEKHYEKGNYSDWFNKRCNLNHYLCSHNDIEQELNPKSNGSFSSLNPRGKKLTTKEFIKYIVNEDYNDKPYNINRLITILKFINGKTI